MACGPRHTKHLSHCLQHLPTFQATFASYAAFYIYVITSAWPAKPPPKAPRPTSSLGRSCAPSSHHASSASAFRGHTSDPESRSSSIDGHVFLECEIIDPCTTRVRPCGKACSPTCTLPLLQRHGSQVTRRTHHLLRGSRPPRIGHPIGRADRRGGHPCAAASHRLADGPRRIALAATPLDARLERHAPLASYRAFTSSSPRSLPRPLSFEHVDLQQSEPSHALHILPPPQPLGVAQRSSPAKQQCAAAPDPCHGPCPWNTSHMRSQALQAKPRPSPASSAHASPTSPCAPQIFRAKVKIPERPFHGRGPSSMLRPQHPHDASRISQEAHRPLPPDFAGGGGGGGKTLLHGGNGAGGGGGGGGATHLIHLERELLLPHLRLKNGNLYIYSKPRL